MLIYLIQCTASAFFLSDLCVDFNHIRIPFHFLILCRDPPVISSLKTRAVPSRVRYLVRFVYIFQYPRTLEPLDQPIKRHHHHHRPRGSGGPQKRDGGPPRTCYYGPYLCVLFHGRVRHPVYVLSQEVPIHHCLTEYHRLHRNTARLHRIFLETLQSSRQRLAFHGFHFYSTHVEALSNISTYSPRSRAMDSTIHIEGQFQRTSAHVRLSPDWNGHLRLFDSLCGAGQWL